MSDETVKDEAITPKKKGGGLVVKAGIALVLLGIGGGAAYGLQLAGVFPGPGHEETSEDNNPKLVLKGEDDPYASLTDAGSEDSAIDIPGDGGNKYRTAYFTFSDDFTSNLKDTTGLIQVSLAASTHHDSRVLLWLEKHELAVRSAVVVVLADTTEDDVRTPEGKQHLQERLTKAINEVLTEAEGFGGVNAVYFRSLLVQ